MCFLEEGLILSCVHYSSHLKWLLDKNGRLLQQTRHVCCTCQGLTGATTVSSTMIAANTTGIPVFVTGGIGGVHRGAQSSESLHL